MLTGIACVSVGMWAGAALVQLNGVRAKANAARTAAWEARKAENDAKWASAETGDARCIDGVWYV